MAYIPMTAKEELQLKLDIIHQNTTREESHYLAAIKANVAVKWDATVQFIENKRAQLAATA